MVIPGWYDSLTKHVLDSFLLSKDALRQKVRARFDAYQTRAKLSHGFRESISGDFGKQKPEHRQARLVELRYLRLWAACLPPRSGLSY